MRNDVRFNVLNYVLVVSQSLDSQPLLTSNIPANSLTKTCWLDAPMPFYGVPEAEAELRGRIC